MSRITPALLVILFLLFPACGDIAATGGTPRRGFIPPEDPLGEEVAQFRAQPTTFDSSVEVGALAGEAGVTPTGQAVYSVSLDVAPGVGGMTPELSLQYQSTAQDGPFGVGFSLGGIAPPVRRCNRTLALDGSNDPFEYELTDPLCWGDERLILVAGTYGLDGAEYRTRRDPFAKIVGHADTHVRESYFEIFTKDGRILTFGAPGALFRTISGDSIPWVWALHRAEDRFGNTIDYRYNAPKPVGGVDPYALLLDEIAYGGTGSETSRRRVRFDYAARSDPSWGYVAGVVQGRTQRVEHIVVEGPDEDLITTYSLTYGQDPVSNRSRIEAISKCDRANACLPPTTFEWSDPAGPAGPLSLNFVPYGLYLGPDADLVDDPASFALSPTRLIGDFDGDSDHDLLYFTDVGWRAWDGTSQFDLLDTPVTVSWPTALPEGDTYVESVIDADVQTAIQAIPEEEELSPEEQQALADSAATTHYDLFQPAFFHMVMEANGDLRDDLLIPRRDLTGGPWEDAWGYRFAQDVVIAVASTPEGESASAGFTEPVSFVEEASGFAGEPIYNVIPLDHDGDGLTDLWLCQGEGYKSGHWILAKREQNPAGPSGHYHFATYDSGVGCSVHDELLVTSLRGGRQDLLVVPAFATGAAMPVPADFDSPQAYHDDYQPLPEDQRTDYLALVFEPGGAAGTLEPTGLPRDQYQRWHDRHCRNGISRDAFGRPLVSAGLGLDKLADVNGDGLVDIVRYELASGDHPGNPEIYMGLTNTHWGEGILCSSDVEGNFPTVMRPYFNTGVGFESGPPMHTFQGNPHANLWLGFHGAQLYDFNLDGILDLLLPSSGWNGGWTAVVSNGDGTYTDHPVALPSGWPAYTDEITWRERMDAAKRLQVMTFAPSVHDRAQITFLGYVEDNPSDWPFLINTLVPNYSEPHDRITKVTDGLGAIVEIEYQRVTAAGPHGTAAMHTYPRTGVKGPLTVATRLATQVNPQVDLEVERYAYHDAVADAWGHGLLGFAEVERWREGEVDHHTWIRYSYERDVQHADYPMVGRPVEQLEQRRVVTDLGEVHYWLTRTQQQFQTVVETHLGGDTLFTYPSRQDVEVFVRDVSCTTDCEMFPSDRFQWLTTEQVRDGFGTIISSSTTNSEEERVYEVDVMHNDEDAWIVGRAETWSEHSCVNGECLERTHAATYDPVTGAVTSTIFAPNDPIARLDTSYIYDNHGNVESSTVTNLQGDIRTTETVWDDEGAFPESMINAIGHQSWVIHDPSTGVLLGKVTADGVTWAHRYDGFLRPTRHERRPSPMALSDGHVTTFEYETGGPVHDDSFEIDSALRVRTIMPDQHESTIDYAATGQVMQESWWGMQDLEDIPANMVGPGGEVYVSTLYDYRGRVHRRSLPTWASEQPAGYTTTSYDGLDRTIEVEHPHGSTEHFAYGLLSKGLQTAHTDENGATSFVQTDGAGRIAVSIDPHGMSTCFEHGAFGVLNEVRRDCTDPQTPWVSTYERDVAGRIIAESDLSFGTRSRVYNGFGELLQETDSAGASVTFDYDALGRVLVRHDADGDTTNTYDVVRPGRLHTSESPDDILTTYGYDSSGRIHSIMVSDFMFTVPGALVFSFDHGPGDRLQSLHYPSVDGDPGLKVDYQYDGAGYLRRVSLHNGVSLWSALQADEAGRLTRERFGNDLETLHSYEPLTGLPTTVETGSPGNLVQSLGYDWHPWGELEQRFDVLHGQEESFAYDDLRRLTQASVTTPFGSSVVDVAYDAVGDILHKTDVGDYTYEDGRLIAYGDGMPVTMGHDARGNVIEHGSQTLAYTPFDKVRQISEKPQTLQYRYDAEGHRFSRHSVIDDDLTVSIQGLYERRDTAGDLRLTYRVPAAGRIVAQVVRAPGIGIVDFGQEGLPAWHDAVEFLHDDHLGSTNVVTDENGAVLRQASFDPWGQARDAEDWTHPVEEDVLDDLGVGFTGHPARLDAGLVDMGGRMYHPVVGRFFSPDPLVVSPLDGQAYNRWSYVHNRPLVATDPTGYGSDFESSNTEDDDVRSLPRNCDSETDCYRPIVVPDPDFTTFEYPNGIGQGGSDHNPHTAGYSGHHWDDSGQPGGTPQYTSKVTPDMCAEIAACSGTVTRRGPVYIWDAPIDEWAKLALDTGTDFIPYVSTAKIVYDAAKRIQNGDDPVDVLMASGADGLLSLIPGGKGAKKLGKALDKAADVADAAGDIADAAADLRKAAKGGRDRAREAGERFRGKSAAEAGQQYEEIDQAQRRVRQGKSNQIIDSTRKSKQRERNNLTHIRSLEDALKEFDD